MSDAASLPDAFAASETPSQPVPVRFTGQTGEYFRIWIVNLGLTLVTLGIYSAWAKVRTRRYLYGNLLLDGSPFEYTADPVKILIGRLIVGAGALLYVLGTSFYPPLSLALIVVFFLASPWIVVRALAFNHRHTRWRNIRFAFRGSYGEAARVYLAWPLLVGVTLGIAAPWYHGRQHAFMVGNSAYGATPFSFRWSGGDYFFTYLGAGLALFVGLAATFALGAALGAGGEGEPDPARALVGAAPMLLAYLIGFTVIRAGTTNLMYRGASLPGVRFDCKLGVAELLWLYVVNAVAIALSLGLLIPWAQIRMARYRAERFQMFAAGDLGRFARATEEAERAGAFADEAAVAFDFDFGL
jgi:uncharacterized membrane protein YjgN (DUF898 family)